MKFTTTFSFTLVMIITLITLPTASAGKVYKWVDEDGNVHYGAQKPTTGAQELSVKTKPASSAEESEPESSSDQQQTAKDQEKEKAGSEKEAAEIAKRNEEIRQQNCSNARKRAATIEQGGRLYEVDESGERHYWDDDTRRVKLEEAEAQINKWCK